MLSWTDLNSKVRVKHTTKKFYNKYLNKIVVFCPGARVVDDKRSHSDLDHVIQTRKERIEYLKKYNRWTWSNRHDTTLWNRDQLAELVAIKSAANQMGIKIRIEEPDVSIYSDDLNLLYSLASRLGGDKLNEIFVPENNNAAEILNRGEIVIKSDLEFSYKIMLREQWNLAAETKASLLDYLYNLGDDEICLTKSIVKNLGDDQRMWFPGGYFYARDDKVATFVSLIAPGIVSGIFKLSKLDQ